MSRPKKASVSESASTGSLINGPSIKKNLLIPGLFDILTNTQTFFDVILKRFQNQAKIYGFQRLETPPLEDEQLYRQYYEEHPARLNELVGFEFQNRSVVLRPELLPSVLRAYAQHKVYEFQIASKWMYFGSTMRQVVKGQLMSDYHLGLEVLGGFNHLTEAQTISGFWHFFKELGLDNISLEINHLGESSCQQTYKEALSGFFSTKKYELCDSCVEHLNSNVINVLRCNNLDCQATASEAPSVLDFLEDTSKKSFTSILEALDELEIPYQLNPLYMGKDGLSKTNCRISFRGKDEKADRVVLAEGGYHDGLMQRIGGKNWCAFGLQSNMSVIAQSLEDGLVSVDRSVMHEVCLVPLGELASKKSLRLFRDLTQAQVTVFDQFGDTGVKNQLKYAVESKTPIALIMGQKEALDEMVILRDVKSGMQEMFHYDKIIEEVKKRLGK